MMNILHGFCVYAITMTMVSLLADGGYHHQQHNSIVITQAPTGDDCQSSIFTLMDCIKYLSRTDGVTIPGTKCCHAFETVLKNNEPCICSALKQAPSMGLDIDLKKAAALPSLCGITNAPPISKCNLTDTAAPETAPSEAPTTKSGATPPTTTSPPPATNTTPSIPPPSPTEAPASRAREPSHMAMFIIPVLLLFLSSVIHSTILN